MGIVRRRPLRKKRSFHATGVIVSVNVIPRGARMRMEDGKRVFVFKNRKYEETLPKSGIFQILKKGD